MSSFVFHASTFRNFRSVAVNTRASQRARHANHFLDAQESHRVLERVNTRRLDSHPERKKKNITICPNYSLTYKERLNRSAPPAAAACGVFAHRKIIIMVLTSIAQELRERRECYYEFKNVRKRDPTAGLYARTTYDTTRCTHQLSFFLRFFCDSSFHGIFIFFSFFFFFYAYTFFLKRYATMSCCLLEFSLNAD